MKVPLTWKYNLLMLSNMGQVQDAMNDLGREGWEFVALTDAADERQDFHFQKAARISWP